MADDIIMRGDGTPFLDKEFLLNIYYHNPDNLFEDGYDKIKIGQLNHRSQLYLVKIIERTGEWNTNYMMNEMFAFMGDVNSLQEESNVDYHISVMNWREMIEHHAGDGGQF